MSGRIFRVEEAVPSWIGLSSLLMCQHIQQELFGDEFAPRDANLGAVPLI